MATPTNNDTAVLGDTQNNFDQVMEILFAGKGLTLEVAMPPVAFNPLDMFIQSFHQFDTDVGTTSNALQNFPVTTAHAETIGEKLSKRLTLRTIVAGNGDDIDLPLLLDSLTAVFALGHHCSADQRSYQSFHIAFHGRYYDSLRLYNKGKRISAQVFPGGRGPAKGGLTTN